jgi:cell division protein FtsB
MLSRDDKGYYSLRYNDLLAPIVKAIQELSGSGKEARAEIKALQADNDQLKARIDRLEKIMQ